MALSEYEAQVLEELERDFVNDRRRAVGRILGLIVLGEFGANLLYGALQARTQPTLTVLGILGFLLIVTSVWATATLIGRHFRPRLRRGMRNPAQRPHRGNPTPPGFEA
jgi:hypothetical protein